MKVVSAGACGGVNHLARPDRNSEQGNESRREERPREAEPCCEVPCAIAQKQQVCAVQYAAANDCFEDVSDDLFHDLSVLCRACRMMARICSVSCIERSSRREKKETIWANDPSK